MAPILQENWRGVDDTILRACGAGYETRMIR
jgi:hypothetical protein